YPDDPGQLAGSVRNYLSQVPKSEGEVPKAVIAPHAGFVYSGLTAAYAYAPILPARNLIKRVVLLGPCHRVAVRGLALSGADEFATPLGEVPLDKEAAGQILHLLQVEVFDATHAEEHSLEVHLPFLQTILEDFKLLPLVVGQASMEEVDQVLEMLWGGPETLIVISSDLSHYLGYDAARQMDGAACRAIEALDPTALADEQACGRASIKGLLSLAKRRNLSVKTVDVRNSGDTAGSKDRVVGYGAWLFHQPASGAHESDFGAQTRELLEKHGTEFLHLSARAILHQLDTRQPLKLDPKAWVPEVAANGASFVTIDKDGQLRGCIGSISAHRPLVVDVAENAFRAAFKDTRFKPVEAREIQEHNMSLTVSVLSPQAPMQFSGEADLVSQLRPEVDGVILQEGQQRGVFLPTVWESLPEPVNFLRNLKRKAGLPEDYWSDTLKAWRYVTETVSSESLPDPKSVWSGD
ncbi:MAG: AmmeMemoRadiSam system protein B, partial [Rhodospirillales bacterium]|nr:AmmeMemoRadiSam system protein B [Rhodospirillales bacterium]